MGWERKQFKFERKQPRHAHIPLCITHCVDCRCQLPQSYLVARFNGRCRACWNAYAVVPVEVIYQSSDMASH